MGKHGGFLTFSDHFDPGHLVPRKWENAMTLDTESWGYRRAMQIEDVHTVSELIVQLARTIACGGNLLLNVGPNMHGIIVPIFVERLRQMGDWLRVNEEAVYGSKPWIYQNDSNIWYTSRMRSNQRHHVFNPQINTDTIIYAFILQWPLDNKLYLPAIKINPKTTATLLGVDAKITVAGSTRGTVVDLSEVKFTQLKSFDAWVVKFEYLNSESRNPVTELQKQGILDRYGMPTRKPTKKRHRRIRDLQNAEDADEIREHNEKLLDRLSDMFENEF